MHDLIANVVKINEPGKSLSKKDNEILEKELNMLLDAIKSCDSETMNSSLLDKLGHLQTELSRACFKWQIPLPKRLRQFVREYDRSDDLELRNFVLKKIKMGIFLSNAGWQN